MPPSPIRARYVDHVTLVVKDMERSRRFYVDLLGLEEVPRPGFRFPGMWFQAGPTQIHLIGEHDESGPAGVRAADGVSISRTNHFAFEVADANTAAAYLREQGIAIVAGPKQRPDGPTQMYVQDPDGHLVELFSR